MKQKIGVVGWKVGENSFGVTVPYLDWIAQFGQPVILMPTSDEVQDIDLLVLPGGLDLAPQVYGQTPGFYTSNVDVHKQWFYEVMLPKYVEAGVSIFGICLGFQQLAAFFGTPLAQNLAAHPYSDTRTSEGHKVTLTQAGGRYLPGLKDNKMGVNSLHHQGVLDIDLNTNELRTLAMTSCEDYKGLKIIESFEHKTRPIAGVQWHPEEWRDGFSYNLVMSLLERAETRKKDDATAKAVAARM